MAYLHRGVNGLTQPGRGIFALDEIHRHRGSFRRAQPWLSIKITLHDATAVMGYFLQPSHADIIDNSALHSVFRAA